MPVSTATISHSISALHDKIISGDSVVMELAINASTYMEPDKYFLLKTSEKIQDFIVLIQLIEQETLEKCEMAYFDDTTDELLGEFPVKAFIEFYKIPMQE